MKKRAFTLVETLIVIIIISILIGISMKFGGNFIDDVRARQVREEWVSDFSILRSKLLLSSSFEGEQRQSITITFAGNAMTTTTDSNFSDTKTYEDIQTISGPNITLTPYNLKCTVNNTPEHITLTFKKSTKTYCYAIDPSTCKASRTACSL